LKYVTLCRLYKYIVLFSDCFAGVVEMHSGKLTGYSEGEGMGSEFRCELPALKLWKGASVGTGEHQKHEHEREHEHEDVCGRNAKQEPARPRQSPSGSITGFLEFCAKQQILEELESIRSSSSPSGGVQQQRPLPAFAAPLLGSKSTASAAVAALGIEVPPYIPHRTEKSPSRTRRQSRSGSSSSNENSQAIAMSHQPRFAAMPDDSGDITSSLGVNDAATRTENTTSLPEKGSVLPMEPSLFRPRCISATSTPKF
jgi:hypothetical protein